MIINGSHAEVLFHVNNELSEKWTKLWNMYVVSIAVTIGGLGHGTPIRGMSLVYG